jgi:hypothetical protein
MLREVELYEPGEEPWRRASHEWETLAERGTVSQPASTVSVVSNPQESLGIRDGVTSDLRHLETDDIVDTVHAERERSTPDHGRVHVAGAASVPGAVPRGRPTTERVDGRRRK